MTVWQDHRRRKAEVEVLQSDEPALDLEKARAVGNLLYASNRGVVHADDEPAFLQTVQEIERAPKTVPLPWRACAVLVDDTAVPFETVTFDHDAWVAVGQVSDSIVTLRGYGVHFEDVALVTVADGTRLAPS